MVFPYKIGDECSGVPICWLIELATGNAFVGACFLAINPHLQLVFHSKQTLLPLYWLWNQGVVQQF